MQELWSFFFAAPVVKEGPAKKEEVDERASVCCCGLAREDGRMKNFSCMLTRWEGGIVSV